jgi:hypothetical protein
VLLIANVYDKKDRDSLVMLNFLSTFATK